MIRPTLYLLDTNIVIFTMNNAPQQVAQRLEQVTGAGHLVGLSSITLHELWFGVYKSGRVTHNTARLHALLKTLDVYPFDDAAAEQSADIRATLRSAGKPIGPYDGLIAGHAHSLGAVLVTNNLGEFSRVERLNVEDWMA